MRAGDGEVGCIVVEVGRRPSACSVALHAVVIEIRCDVVRIHGAVEVIGMAVITDCRQALILVVHMTVRAGDGLMSTREWEYRRGMAEGGR